MALLIIPGKERSKTFDVLTSDQELEVRTVTYGPEIDQSQHAKAISHIITKLVDAPFVFSGLLIIT